MSLWLSPWPGAGSILAAGPASPWDPEPRCHRLHLGTGLGPQDTGLPGAHVCPPWRRCRCGEGGRLPRLCLGHAGHRQHLAPTPLPGLASQARAGLQAPEAGSSKPVCPASDRSGHGSELKCVGISSVCPLPGWEPSCPASTPILGTAHLGPALTSRWSERCQEMGKSKSRIPGLSGRVAWPRASRRLPTHTRALPGRLLCQCSQPTAEWELGARLRLRGAWKQCTRARTPVSEAQKPFPTRGLSPGGGL